MRRVVCFAVVLLCPWWILLPACKKRSSAAPGNLNLVTTNVVPGESRPVNLPLEFTFDREIDPATLSLATFRIDALPPAVAGAPTPDPVQGQFFIKDGGKTVAFQPLCPDSANPLWGFTPGNDLGAVAYSVTILDASNNEEGVIRGMDGSALIQPFTVQFETAAPPERLVQDPQPAHPPRVSDPESLPKTLGLNLFSSPNPPMEIHLDQPLQPETLGDHPVRLSFEHPELGRVTIPTETALTENCTDQGGAILSVVPRGILPAGREVEFRLNKDLSGLGTGDTNPEDILFLTARVAEAFRPVQRDTITETFDTTEFMDPNPNLVSPLATWKGGRLEAVPVWSGTDSEIEIVIGGGTPNGRDVFFDTNGGILKDLNGQPHFFADGIIEVKSLRLGNAGQKGNLFVIGPNPLIIRATDFISISQNSKIELSGQDAPDVTNIGAPTSSSPGGSGYGSGGDGGRASEETAQSTPKGGNGRGAFQAPDAGGEGGHTGYGNASTKNVRGGGGGGGNWNIRELDASGNWVEFCAGNARWETDCIANKPNRCGAGGSNKSSNGTQGSNGPKKIGNCTHCFTAEGERVCGYDAITGGCWPQGGSPGGAVFFDGNPENDFFGRKPRYVGGQIEVEIGELQRVQGGQGAGGGGDTVRSAGFPSRSFPANNVRAAGGGGGAGAVVLHSLGFLRIFGTVIAKGGNGGNGEKPFGDREGPGGGGGAGGMIVMEAPFMEFGPQSNIRATGGMPGRGGGDLPGYATGSGGNDCRYLETAAKGGYGGKGVIQLHASIVEGLTTTCGGATQPQIQDETIVVWSDVTPSVRRSIRCENQLNEFGNVGRGFYRKFDPSPHILIPTFGTRSGHQSKWRYLGSPSEPISFHFQGTDPATGEVDSAFTEILASGRGGVVEQSDYSVTLDNASLAEFLHSAPAAIRENGFRVDPSQRPRRIVNATLVDSLVTLEMDPAEGVLPSIGDWEIQRYYFQTLVNGQQTALPQTAKATILFQGARSTSPGSGVPDLTTVTPAAADPTTLVDPATGQPYPFLRFRVLFDSNAQGDPLRPTAPLPGLERLRLPLSF